MKVWGAKRIRYPISPHRKRFTLLFILELKCTTIPDNKLTAISVTPCEYCRKSENKKIRLFRRPGVEHVI